MNLLSNYTVDGTQRKIIVCSIEGSNLFTVLDFLQANPNCTDFLLDSTESNDLDRPFLIPTAGTGLDFSAVFNVFDRCNLNVTEELFGQIAQILKNSLPDISTDFIKLALEGYKEFKAYLEGKSVRITLNPSQFALENISHTQELVNQINASGRIAGVQIKGENKTLVQENAEDELFIYIPSYDELVLGMDLLPDLRTVFDPYKGNKKLSTLEWRNHLTSSIRKEFVVGSPENNELPIQPNEQRYYDGLCDLLRVGTQNEYPDVPVEQCLHPESGSAAICSTIVMKYLKNIAKAAVFTNWLHTGIYPTNLNVECMEHDPRLDEEAETILKTDDGSTATGSHEFYELPQGTPVRDGAIELENILDGISYKDPYAVVSVVIQLLRWGSRKPTRVSVGDSKFLDIQGLVLTSSSGNYGTADILVDEDGNNLFLAGLLYLKDFIKDATYKMQNKVRSASFDLPIGFICNRKSKAGDPTQFVFLTFLDVIMSYRSNDSSCRIAGVSYHDGRISVDPEILADLVQQDTSLTVKEALHSFNESAPGKFVLYQYDGLKNEFMSSNCLTKNQSIIYLLNKYINAPNLSETSNYRYSTKEELQDLCAQTSLPPSTFIESNMVNYLLPVFIYVNEKKSDLVRQDRDPSLADIIEFFQEAVASLGFTGSFDSNAPVSAEVTVTAEPPKVTESTSFIAPQAPQRVSAPQAPQAQPDLIDTDQGDYQIWKVYMKKTMFDSLMPFYQKESAKGSIAMLQNLEQINVPDPRQPNVTEPCVVIGYAKCKPAAKGAHYTFIHPSELQGTPVNSGVNADSLGAILSLTLKRVANQKPLDHKFGSTKAVSYYATLVNKIVASAFRSF